MNENEFFEGDEGAPSPITLVVSACVSDFTNAYQAKADGTFRVVENGRVSCVLRESEVIVDIHSWLMELQYGENAVTDKVISLVKSNPAGWGDIIARRVIRELRKWAT